LQLIHERNHGRAQCAQQIRDENKPSSAHNLPPQLPARSNSSRSCVQQRRYDAVSTRRTNYSDNQQQHNNLAALLHELNWKGKLQLLPSKGFQIDFGGSVVGGIRSRNSAVKIGSALKTKSNSSIADQPNHIPCHHSCHHNPPPDHQTPRHAVSFGSQKLIIRSSTISFAPLRHRNLIVSGC
jgi:hypothetical protein